MKKLKIIIFLILLCIKSYAQTWHRANLTEDTTVVICTYYDSTTNELYVGGLFKTFNGVVANNIVKWNGNQWLPVGDGFNRLGINAITKYKGAIIAAGIFDSSGTTRFNMPIAKWNGTQWLPLDTITVHHIIDPNKLPSINSLAVNDDKLYAIGYMYYSGPFPGTNNFFCFASWNDTLWQRLLDVHWHISGLYDPKLMVYNNELYLAQVLGVDSCLGSPATLSRGLLKYNSQCRSLEIIGSNWGNGLVSSLISWNGSLYVGFDHDNSIYGSYITRYDGTSFYPLGTGLNLNVEDLIIYNNQLVAAGRFTADGTNTQSLSYIAMWNGSSWVPFPAQCNFNSGGYCLSGHDSILIASAGFVYCDSAYMGYSAIYPSQLTGFKEITIATKKISVNPNPTTGLFIIAFEESGMSTALVSIPDLTGKHLLNSLAKCSNGYCVIDASELSSGLYVLKVQTEEGLPLSTSKLVINK